MLYWLWNKIKEFFTALGEFFPDVVLQLLPAIFDFIGSVLSGLNND